MHTLMGTAMLLQRRCGQSRCGRSESDVKHRTLQQKYTRNAKLGARHTLYAKRYALYSAQVYSAHISGQLMAV